MAINHKELKKLVSFARRQGLLSVKADGFEIQLHPAALFPSKANATPEPEAPKLQIQFTDEELLYFSSTPAGGN